MQERRFCLFHLVMIVVPAVTESMLAGKGGTDMFSLFTAGRICFKLGLGIRIRIRNADPGEKN